MKRLVSRAEEILEQNWKDGFTIPTSKLYPFQWNWDSGFTSIGHSYFNLNRAILELESLFSAQWQNGMVPHIVFHSEQETTYFPNYDFWDCGVNPGAPSKPKTSGITQPAVHGFILAHLLDKFPDNQALISFARQLYPKIVESHRFCYTYRDPEREGLMFIFHPWESGRDNSPLWDASLDRIVIDASEIPTYSRRDINLAPTEERPTSYQYDRYVYLLQYGKKRQYDGRDIFDSCPFLVQDTLMNAVLIKSNDSLIKMGERFGFDTGEVKEWQSQSRKAFSEKLWNSNLETFVPYDLRAGEQMQFKEIGSYVSLFAQSATEEQAHKLNSKLSALHDKGFYLCPSFDVESEWFDSKRYWRGPVWPQMNWMIYHGLLKYGYKDTARIVKSDIIELVGKMGYYEYFEPRKSLAQNMTSGYGGGSFSWTAACVLDLLKEEDV